MGKNIRKEWRNDLHARNPDRGRAHGGGAKARMADLGNPASLRCPGGDNFGTGYAIKSVAAMSA